MAASYFFYDLETSGINSTTARIMQFAGQRTNAQLQPVGDPVNVLISLAADVLPEPDAIMLTGITPQTTILEGLTEAEFLQFFYKEVVQPDTCFLGFNTVRFDDEFMRMLQYRNFYDAYAWQWQNGCSRWDMLDVVRMTRALRPDGIQWPVTPEGKATNRLELLTTANQLNHEQAHDALSDVHATIAIARLIRDKQSDLFKYLATTHDKKAVAAVVESGRPFVYTSGRYPVQNLHTTAAIMLAKHVHDSALVYDLRHDPRPFMAMTPEQLVEVWRYNKDRPADFVRLPVKTIKYNRCPTVAPVGVIKDETTQQRINLTMSTVNQNLAHLRAGHHDFAERVHAAVQLLDAERPSAARPVTSQTVDGLLYDGFFEAGDARAMQTLRQLDPAAINPDLFNDTRLQALTPLYKARNYPAVLTGDERQAWERHVSAQLFDGGQASRVQQYFTRLQELGNKTLTSQQEYLLEELQLYAESIVPTDTSEQ